MSRGVTLRIHKAVVVRAENTPRLLYKTDLQFISDTYRLGIPVFVSNWIERWQISLQVRRIRLFLPFCRDISRRISGIGTASCKACDKYVFTWNMFRAGHQRLGVLFSPYSSSTMSPIGLLTLASRRVFEDAKRHSRETSIRCSPASPAARKTREQKGACHANYERERERESQRRIREDTFEHCRIRSRDALRSRE